VVVGENLGTQETLTKIGLDLECDAKAVRKRLNGLDRPGVRVETMRDTARPSSRSATCLAAACPDGESSRISSGVYAECAWRMR
jgi:hypothetical protein